MAQYKAIIFDMDGLLVDSEKIWHIAEIELVEARSHKYREDVRIQLIGLRMSDFMKIIRKAYNLDETVEELNAELVQRMQRLIPTEEVHPGAQEIIDYVSANDIPHAIASSSSKNIIDAILEFHGWSDKFTVRCSAEDDANGKPAPDVYIRTAKVIEIAPADCLALEDSPNGARAAVAAGMTCYAVPDSSHSGPEDFEGITPHIFGSLHDVLAHLKSNGQISSSDSRQVLQK